MAFTRGDNFSFPWGGPSHALSLTPGQLGAQRAITVQPHCVGETLHVMKKPVSGSHWCRKRAEMHRSGGEGRSLHRTSSLTTNCSLPNFTIMDPILSVQGMTSGHAFLNVKTYKKPNTLSSCHSLTV